MNNITKIKSSLIQLLTMSLVSVVATSCMGNNPNTEASKVAEANTPTFAKHITIENIALNPEGIEYDKNDHTFLLSSLNAAPILKVNLDGTYKPFTTGEPYPMSTAGLQVDYKRNRLLVAAFNGTELMDNDPATKGTAHLRVYDLTTGVMKQDIDLSSLVPEADAYFANDVAVDSEGNVYISDWYASLIYKVDKEGVATLFWRNNSGIPGGPNGLDVHPDGYLLVSIINDGYKRHGLIKIPLDNPAASTTVKIDDKRFAGFDGMVVTSNGDVVGITNNQKAPGGNMLLELSTKDAWKSAEIITAKEITTSTTIAVTPEHKYYVINQDFSDNFKKVWNIELIEP